MKKKAEKYKKSKLQSFKNLSKKGYYIFGECIIDSSAIIYPNVYFFGDCKVGANTIIFPGSVIDSSEVGDNCLIKSSYIEGCIIKDNVTIGPFAHLRPNSNINSGCKIGNFVEIKSSELGEGCKASHLAYIGDASIGKNCNIGCGAIFVNYNGRTKSKTTIGNNCFVGSNCNLIAPLEINDSTYICAGTTVTKSSNAGDFIIGRTKETVKSWRAYKYLKSKE